MTPSNEFRTSGDWRIRTAIPDVTGRSIQQLVSLEGRTAVVNGGAHGIGAAVARRFLAR